MSGVVHLVGAGPGPADLLTIRAARLLGEADVVVHDALVAGDALDLAPRARRLNVGKRAGRPSADQAFICKLIVRLARRGARVVRLKGGDPMLFGRAAEEIAACRAAGVPVTVTPGVTAAFAAAADLQTSLTARGLSRSVAFVTPSVARGATGGDAWALAAAAAETAVVYMGLAQAEALRAALLAAGIAPGAPLAIVESAGAAPRILRGRLGDLTTLAAQTGEGPKVVVIGEVVREACAQTLAAVAA